MEDVMYHGQQDIPVNFIHKGYYFVSISVQLHVMNEV